MRGSATGCRSGRGGPGVPAASAAAVLAVRRGVNRVSLSGSSLPPEEEGEEVRMAAHDFMELFLRHQDDLKAFIGSVVADPHARADIFQDVALTLWKQIGAYDPSRPFGAWAARRGRPQGAAGPREVGTLPWPSRPRHCRPSPTPTGAPSATADRAAALRECLARLPEKSRTLAQALRGRIAWRGDRPAARRDDPQRAVPGDSRLQGPLEESVTTLQEHQPMDSVLRRLLGQRLLDGSASPDEMAELDALLRTAPRQRTPMHPCRGRCRPARLVRQGRGQRPRAARAVAPGPATHPGWPVWRSPPL